MKEEGQKDPITLIQDYVRAKRVFWTYHVNMRLRQRAIPREWIFQSVSSYILIESYPQDKYLPSYLIWAQYKNTIFHILFAIDNQNRNVRIITAYKPDQNEWTNSFQKRILR